MSKTLQERLRIKAGVMSMGEKITFGSDTELMYEAADKIDQLEEAKGLAVNVASSISKTRFELEANVQYLNDELTEAYNQLAEKHDDIREERDKLKLAVNRIHKHLEGIAEYQCSDDMWSIFLAIDEEVEDVLDETT